MKIGIPKERRPDEREPRLGPSGFLGKVERHLLPSNAMHEPQATSGLCLYAIVISPLLLDLRIINAKVSRPEQRQSRVM